MPEAAAKAKKLTGTRKAAVLLITLGDKPASQILKCLPQPIVQRLTAEIASVDSVAPEVSAEILDEFNKQVIVEETKALGGARYAEKLLESAFGTEEAGRLMERAASTRGTKTLDLTDLSQANPAELAKLIQDEQPQTVALVLAHVGAKAGSGLLALLPDSTRGTVVERLAKMGQLSGETVQNVLQVVHRKFKSLGRRQERVAFGGVNAVAGILNHVEPATSKAILEAIEQTDANLAVAIRDVMFTFDDLLTVPQASIRETLGALDKKTLAMALKGASADLREHIMKCMSSRAADMLKEDMEALGPVRVKEVSKAQVDIVNTLRSLEAEGKITLRNEEADAFVV
jgi:flagellar motor switch protein FliG